jgi:hypothetical protein
MFFDLLLQRREFSAQLRILSFQAQIVFVRHLRATRPRASA